jgi:hypothetical protein
MKKIVLILLISISTISLEQESSIKEDLLKKSIVIKKDTLSMDDFNDLVVLLNGRVSKKELKKLNHYGLEVHRFGFAD